MISQSSRLFVSKLYPEVIIRIMKASPPSLVGKCLGELRTRSTGPGKCLRIWANGTALEGLRPKAIDSQKDCMVALAINSRGYDLSAIGLVVRWPRWATMYRKQEWLIEVWCHCYGWHYSNNYSFSFFLSLFFFSPRVAGSKPYSLMTWMSS